jgi:hypothetical protein
MDSLTYSSALQKPCVRFCWGSDGCLTLGYKVQLSGRVSYGKRPATLTEEEYLQLGKCRRPITGLASPIGSPLSGSLIVSHSSPLSSSRNWLLQRYAAEA